MDQPKLGEKVLELRKRKRLTQTELAEACKISLRTIQRIESTEATPRNYTIKAIFSALDYDLEDLQTNELSDTILTKKDLIKIWLNKFPKNIFNLKTNPIVKFSALLCVIILIIAISFISVNKSHLQNQKIEGWFLTGSSPESYKIGLDTSIYVTKGSAAFIESKDKKAKGFGTLMQTCSAHLYIGKRVKMTAYIKSHQVSNWASAWLRIDNYSSKKSKKVLNFDNMRNRPIKNDSDWTKCEIILDVPQESTTLNFGVLLNGTGKVWFDNIRFDIVDKSKIKETKQEIIKIKPFNLDFN